MNDQEIKRKVREGYARAAQQDSCCAPSDSACCSGADTVGSASRRMGYSDNEIKEVPEGSNLGLGCGNPTAIASLKPGETVLDLGSGAGFDCFLAAARVGKNGRVIGVDMTPEMINKARENAVKGDYDNVEFRLGEIEHLPVADNTVDVIISNCVINLAPDKDRVFQEAFRVLKPGGRIMVSDIVLKKELPEAIRRSVEAYVGCIAGASLQDAYLGAIDAAGFENIEVISEREINVTSVAEQSQDPGAAAASINVAAVKP